ncbi:hypothetical protein B0H13DRAFT_1516983, partial [Mycena leptocephala]
EWIGRNKTYPSAPPAELDASCNRKLSIPPMFLLVFRDFLSPGCPWSYSKTGGKNGKHVWVSDCLNIAAGPTQVFEHMFGGLQFRSIPKSMQNLQVPRYALIPSISFLCLLSQAPQSVNVGIKLSPADSAVFKKINSHLPDIMAAVKAFRAKKKS